MEPCVSERFGPSRNGAEPVTGSVAKVPRRVHLGYATPHASRRSGRASAHRAAPALPEPPGSPMSRIRPLLFLLAVIVGVKLSDQVYRWAAFGEERAMIRELRPELVEAGAVIVRTRAQSDTMRARIAEADRRLETEQRTLRRYDRIAHNGTLPQEIYQRYKRDLNRYNEQVTARNEQLRRWQEVLAENHAAVDRYNALADSARALAQEMGDPYYNVPSPLEAAQERGLIKPTP